MMALNAILTALSLAVVRADASFNAEELSSAIYDVDILGEPKLATEMISSPTSMLLLSKHGQRYECALPANVHTIGTAAPAGKEETKDRRSEEEEAKLKNSLTQIPKLLDYMASENCLRLGKGWWEYEFCFRKRIRQFHVNEQTGATESESILGEFESDFDWRTSDLTQLTGPKKAPLAHTQFYSGGSLCDLTRQPRRAEVRFLCDPNTLAVDTLVDVEEPASCVYRLTVRTSRLCSHPLLRKAAEEELPSQRRAAESIQCRPLLEPTSMQRFEKAREAKRLAAVKEAERQKLQRIQRLNPLRRLARIRHVIAGRFGRPLRQRKLAQLARRRHLQQRALNLEKPPQTLQEPPSGLKEALNSLPPEIRQKLASRRGLRSLKSGISAQFEQILQDARKEVGEPPQEGQDAELVNSMSTMLQKVLKQVKEAGRSAGEKPGAEQKGEKQSKKERKARAENEVPPVTDKAQTARDRLLKTLQKKRPGRASKTKVNSEAEAESVGLSSDDVEKLRGRLEAGFREKMERRGIETNGLTLHLMSLGDSAGNDAEEDKSKSFVGIFIVKNDRQIREQQRMERLELNYNFRVDNEP